MSDSNRLETLVDGEYESYEGRVSYVRGVRDEADTFVEAAYALDTNPVGLYNAALKAGFSRKDSLGFVSPFSQFANLSPHHFPSLCEWLLDQGVSIPELLDFCPVSDKSAWNALREHDVVEREYKMDGSVSWSQVRDVVIDRDDEDCQICHETLDEKDRHVHHVIPRRFFDNEDLANDRSNLVLLCPEHHRWMEGFSPQELFKYAVDSPKFGWE